MNDELTSFRALAFFAVFLFHIHVLSAGYLGVQAFFVLSGFLITPILIDMKAALSVRDFFVNFYGRRALRTFPLYYLYLLAVAAISLLVTSQEGYKGIDRIDRFLEQLPWALTFTYNFFHASELFRHTHLVTHFWALAVEWQFYLTWPLLVFFTPHRYVKKILLVIILMGPVIRLLISIITLENICPIVLDFVDMVIYVLPFSYMDAFAIGGYFALYQKSGTRGSTWLVIIGAVLLGFVTDYMFSPGSDIDISSLGYAPFMVDSYKYVWGYSVINLVLAYMLIQIRDRKFIPTLFKNNILIYLGNKSYGLYIFHFPIIWLMFYQVKLSDSLLISGLLSLIMSIVISIISDELIEKKFVHSKDRYFPRKSIGNALNRTETLGL
jgi:peptidoglycan/LPS O-acetylase OafA/YrhL